MGGETDIGVAEGGRGGAVGCCAGVSGWLGHWGK